MLQSLNTTIRKQYSVGNLWRRTRGTQLEEKPKRRFEGEKIHDPRVRQRLGVPACSASSDNEDQSEAEVRGGAFVTRSEVKEEAKDQLQTKKTSRVATRLT